MDSRVEGPKFRIASLDALRGTVMLLMLAEVMRLPSLARAFPDSAFWRFVAFHTSHVEWRGCSLHDLIQPGFSFLVGAALPFSIAARRAKGGAFPRMLAHAAWRAVLLIALGMFVRSVGRPHTVITFTDTLGQIGLGYVFLFLLGFVRMRAQGAALALILLGYWAAFAIHPGHWAKNANLGTDFDLWFLNLFPRERPYTGNPGGYSTLNFVPTLGTMILGLLTGEWLKSPRRPEAKLRGMALAGCGLVLTGLAADWAGLCPIVKRIWTPPFVLYSGGWVLLMLSAFYALMEWKQWKGWAYPLVVVGMNSIAIYVMSWTMEGFVLDTLNTHLGRGTFAAVGPAFETPLRGLAAMAVFWLILAWMHRRRIFLRI